MTDEQKDDEAAKTIRFLDPMTGEAKETVLDWDELGAPDRVTLLFWLWYGELAQGGYELPDLARGTCDALINLVARYCPDEMVEPVLEQIVKRIRRGVPTLRLDQVEPAASTAH